MNLNAQICASIERVKVLLKALTKEQAHVTYFGATDIDPKHLVVWLCVETDAECARLEANLLSIRDQIHACFRAEHYPSQAVPFIGVGVAAQETVTRDYKGNWWHFFK